MQIWNYILNFIGYHLKSEKIFERCNDYLSYLLLMIFQSIHSPNLMGYVE